MIYFILLVILVVTVMAIREYHQLIDASSKHEVHVTVELHGNTFYAFLTEDKAEFVCQGASITELREAFKLRFPIYTLVIDKYV